jgi:hypothetical protein
MKARTTGNLIIAATLIAATNAHPENYTAAATACQTWTDLRANNRATPEMNWLQGHMMAAFDHHPALQKHKTDFSSEKLYSGIDSYCAQNPSHSLHAAVHQLELSLIKVYSPPP